MGDSHRLGAFPSSSVLLSVSFLGSLSVPFRHLLLPSLGFSFVSLLLSFLLPLLPVVPRGSSPFGGPFPTALLVMALAFFGGFSSYWVASISLLAIPCSFTPPLLLGFPSMRPPHTPLLGPFRICPCIILVPLLRDSVESQFLRDGVLPKGPVSSVGGFVLSFSWLRFLSASLWYPFSSVQFSPSLGCVGSPLLRRVFLGVSLPLFVAGWRFPSVLVLFLFLLSPVGGFPSSILLRLPFSLVLFPYG